MQYNAGDSQMALIAELCEAAPELDQTGAFPTEAFNSLTRRGLTGLPPLANEDIGKLLRLLATVGRGDLNVGRIYEGHVNALWLIRNYGSLNQRTFYDTEAADGALFGVWNTDKPGAPLHLHDDILRGAKNFASGVDGLKYAIVTISPAEGRRMVIVPTQLTAVDRSWWKPMGMRASGSHIAEFDGITAQPEWMLGEPDLYIKEPWFSGGAIRFAAVQTGGMHAIFDVALAHLQTSKRASAPYQCQRLAHMAIAVETAYGWLDRAAIAWKEAAFDPDGAKGDALLAVACATRIAVETAAMNVLAFAEQAVGAAGFIAPHPLERKMRDLRTYLRQPNPDGALAAVGTAINENRWLPGSAS